MSHGVASFLATAALLLLYSKECAAQTAERDHVLIGAGAAVVPAFQGSEDHRVLPLPAVDIREGWFVANVRNGAGLSPVNTDVLTAGVSAVFIQGYRRKDVRPGIDRLTDGLGARIFANLRTGAIATTLGVTKGVAGGTKGVVADVSVSHPLPLSSRLLLVPIVAATWSDARHNDRYFGVTTREAASTGLLSFAPGAGFKDASIGLTASYSLTDRIGLAVTGTLTTLLGSVADSPQVERRTRPSTFLTFSYRP